MTTLRRRMLEDLQLRGLALKTPPCDVAAVHQLAQHDRRPPDQRSDEDLRPYVLDRLKAQKVAESTCRLHRYGSRCFDALTRQRPWPVFDCVRPRHPQQLPVVWSPRDVQDLLALVKHPTARMCLRIIDACGLRLREGTGPPADSTQPAVLKFGYKISHGLRAHIVRECPGGGRGLEAYR